MKSKFFSCALLLSLSLPVTSLHGTLDDVKNTLGWLMAYIVRATTVGGSVGGAWFLLTKAHALMAQKGRKPHDPNYASELSAVNGRLGKLEHNQKVIAQHLAGAEGVLSADASQFDDTRAQYMDNIKKFGDIKKNTPMIEGHTTK